MEFEKQINEEFCKEVGIKKVCVRLENCDTGEIKYYTNNKYKKPKGWNNIIKHKYDPPKYPDLIGNSTNFCYLINVQWNMFGSLGDIYGKTGDENFQLNYVKTRLKALKLCRSFGGGGMLDAYKEQINKIKFEY